jgi:hypothetical protein
MVTFVGDKKDTAPVVIDLPKREGTKNPLIGEIKLKPVWHGWQRDRMWIWFPLLMEAECFGKTLAFEWLKVYPRIIQWEDGKYYTFRGTHSAIPEYGIKGDNTVYYREILVEQGEKIEYV